MVCQNSLFFAFDLLMHIKRLLSLRDSKLARARSKRIKKYKRYALIGAASGLGGVLIGKLVVISKRFLSWSLLSGVVGGRDSLIK